MRVIWTANMERIKTFRSSGTNNLTANHLQRDLLIEEKMQSLLLIDTSISPIDYSMWSKSIDWLSPKERVLFRIFHGEDLLNNREDGHWSAKDNCLNRSRIRFLHRRTTGENDWNRPSSFVSILDSIFIIGARERILFWFQERPRKYRDFFYVFHWHWTNDRRLFVLTRNSTFLPRRRESTFDSFLSEQEGTQIIIGIVETMVEWHCSDGWRWKGRISAETMWLSLEWRHSVVEAHEKKHLKGEDWSDRVDAERTICFHLWSSPLIKRWDRSSSFVEHFVVSLIESNVDVFHSERWRMSSHKYQRCDKRRDRCFQRRLSELTDIPASIEMNVTNKGQILCPDQWFMGDRKTTLLVR
jgi:hypothetical protein